jgi:hypothetical protein
MVGLCSSSLQPTASVPIPIKSLPPPLPPTPRIRAGTDQKCFHMFLAHRANCIPDLSYTGPFEDSPFEAGTFEAAPFESGPFESGRFAGVTEAPYAVHGIISPLSLFASDDAPVIYFLCTFSVLRSSKSGKPLSNIITIPGIP